MSNTQRGMQKAHSKSRQAVLQEHLPSVEEIQQELGKAESIDDFFGKEGIMSCLFARTLEQLLEAELTAKLGYEKYEAKGRNSGNSRNGKRSRRIQSSGGEIEIAVPRDRNGGYEPELLERYKGRSNEIEQKVIGLYAKGMTTRDIGESLADMYGVEVSAAAISTITEQVLLRIYPRFHQESVTLLSLPPHPASTGQKRDAHLSPLLGMAS